MDVDAATEIRAAVLRSMGDGPAASAVVDDLLARHAEPHRRYHTAEHVRWVLRHVDRLCSVIPADRVAAIEIDREALDAAAVFHDAIYDPRSATNEADSAALAALHLRRLGWPADRIAAVEQLIVATAGHAATTEAEAILLDADLAILGSSATDYSNYVRQVRAEYSFVDDPAWRIGRAEVLLTFLDRDRIYVTPTLIAEREQQARSNIAAELAALRSARA